MVAQGTLAGLVGNRLKKDMEHEMDPYTPNKPRFCRGVRRFRVLAVGYNA